MNNDAFFGEQGLTATSAQHLSSMANNLIELNKKDLNNIEFFSTSIATLTSGTPVLLSKGWDAAQLKEIPAILKQICDANSFIAWCREAIKAKKALDRKVDELDFTDWCAQTGRKLPELLPKPEDTVPTATKKTQEWVIENILTSSERYRYYKLQAYTTTIGKYIHPVTANNNNGSFHAARQRFFDIQIHPVVKTSSAEEGILLQYFTPTVENSDVEDLYKQLTDSQRSYQAELNGLLHKIDLWIEEDYDKQLAAVSKAEHDYYEAYNAYKEAYNEYIIVKRGYRTEFEDYKMAEHKRIRELKIVIPEALQEIYKKLQD